MKRFLFALALVLLTGLIFFLTQRSTDSTISISPPVAIPSIASNAPTYHTQKNSEGAVTIEITPLSLSTQENAQFQVALNTHSVDLNYNLADLATLADNQGKIYQPIGWEGGSGGHHLQGNLIFPKLQDNPQKVELTINGIDSRVRRFSWEL